jgi:hypothetical protein
MEALFADVPVGRGQHAGDRQALQPHPGAGQAAAAQLPDPAGGRRPCRWTSTSATCPTRGWKERLKHLFPDEAERERAAPALCGAAGVRAQHHPQDGLPGLLPDRVGLHQVGQGKRLPGGAGPGLRRRLAGGLRAADHRPRPAAVQPAVRALPEPGAGVHARLRHRLLPVQPRPGDRLCEGPLRQGRGEPDRHLRHHGRARGHPRRGPGARPLLRFLRRHLQADSQQAGHERDAAVPAQPEERGRQEQLRDRDGAHPGRAHREGRGRQDPDRAGAEARGHDPQHRHARRRRADRAGQADRLLPAVHAAGQRIGGEPVRQGRRRGHRPGEVRLSGPGHADHPGDRARIHHEAPQGPGELRFENVPLDDKAVYALFSAGQTEAVFQFESRGMQGMLRDAKPTGWKT